MGCKMFVLRYVIFSILLSSCVGYSSHKLDLIEFNNSVPQFVYEEEFTVNKEVPYVPHNLKYQLNLMFRLGHMLSDISTSKRQEEISRMKKHTLNGICNYLDEEFVESLNHKSKSCFDFNSKEIELPSLDELKDAIEKFDASSEKIKQIQKLSFSIFKNILQFPYFYSDAYKGLLSVSDQMNVPMHEKLKLIQSLMWQQDVYYGYSKENSLKLHIYENYPELLPFEEAFQIAEEKYFKSASTSSTQGLHPITLKILSSIANASDEDSRKNVRKARAQAQLRLFELAVNFQEAFTESLNIIKKTRDWKSLIRIFENRTKLSQKKDFNKGVYLEFDSLIKDTHDSLKNIALPLDEKLALAGLLVRQLKNHGELIEKTYFARELNSQLVFEFFTMILGMESPKAQNFLHYVMRSFNQIILGSDSPETLDMGVLLVNELLAKEDTKYNPYILSVFETFLKKEAFKHSTAVLVKVAKSKSAPFVQKLLSSLHKTKVSQLFTDLAILFIDEFETSGHVFFEKIKEKEEYLKFFGYEKLPSFKSLQEQENFFRDLKEKISYGKFLRSRELSKNHSLEESYSNIAQQYTSSENIEVFIKNYYKDIYTMSFDKNGQIFDQNIHPILRPLYKYLNESKHNYVQFLTSEAVNGNDILFNFVLDQAYGNKEDVSLLDDMYLCGIYEYYYYKNENGRNMSAYKKRELSTSPLSEIEFLESFIKLQKVPQQETFNLISQKLDEKGVTLRINFDLWKKLMQKGIYPENLIIGAGFENSLVRESKFSMTDFSIDIEEKRSPSLTINAFNEVALTELSDLLKNKIKLIKFDHVLDVLGTLMSKKELKFYNVKNLKGVFEKYFSMLQPDGKLKYFSLVTLRPTCWNKPIKLENSIKTLQEIGFELLQEGICAESFYGSGSASYYIGLKK